MKTLKTLLPLTCLLLLPLAALATPIAYPFRITDNSGTLVAGATVSIGATPLTSGSATVTPAAAGEKLLATNAAPAATVSVTLLDYGTGDYALVYDPAVSGELYIPLTVSKAGSTFTGGAALIALVAAADSSTIIGVGSKTALIATNAMDSPNAITSQGNASTLLLSLATYQSVLTAGSTASVLSTALVGTADLTGAKVVFTTGINKGVTRTITSMNSGTGAINLLTTTPNTPGATDAFSVVQGSKALEQFLAGLGSDSRPVLSANTQPAMAITNALPALDGTGRVTLVPGQSVVASNLPTDYQQRGVAVLLPTAPTGYGGGSTADTPGTTTLLAKIGTPAGASLAADLAAVKADTGNIVTSVAGLSAATLAAIKADSQFSVLLNRQKQRFLYVPSTHSYQPLLDDGTTTFGSPLILSIDSLGNILQR